MRLALGQREPGQYADHARRTRGKDDRLERAANANAVTEAFELNRRAWDAATDAYQARHGGQLSAAPQAWGIWSLPETELRLLGDVADLDVLEYACGAARGVHAAGEAAPFPAQHLDVVFCDHGAMSSAAPEETIPEVARILRPDGIFVFDVEHPLHASSWLDAASGPTRTLHEPYFALGRIDEPQPPPDASSSYDKAPLAWARDFPAELIVRARRR